MKILTDKNITIEEPTSITLGKFDGIHLGHRELIKTVTDSAEAHNLISVVFTFDPHPVTVLKKNRKFFQILSKHEKRSVIEDMGVDILIEYPFTLEFAGMDAHDFAHFLFYTLNCRVLVVGEDYSFGKSRLGDYELLKRIGDERGADVIKIPYVMYKGTRVSSSRVRKYISGRNFETASKLLNRPYFVKGVVAEGKKIGRTIGFPTVNINPPDGKLLPPDGVYLTRTLVDGETLGSITNIGSNPTLGGRLRTVETFLMEFDETIYGKEITICFYKFLREEIKFDGVDELRAQIGLDIEKAKEELIKK